MRNIYLEHVVLISLVSLLVGLGFWMNHGLPVNKNSSAANLGQDRANYFFQYFKVLGRSEADDGYILTGDRLEHLPSDSSINISKPCLFLFDNDGQSQLVLADHGQVMQDGTLIIFKGNVQIWEHTAPAIRDFLSDPLSVMCAPPNISHEKSTRADKITLQLKPRLRR